MPKLYHDGGELKKPLTKSVIESILGEGSRKGLERRDEVNFWRETDFRRKPFSETLER